jgi:hypothetical protein
LKHKYIPIMIWLILATDFGWLSKLILGPGPGQGILAQSLAWVQVCFGNNLPESPTVTPNNIMMQ